MSASQHTPTPWIPGEYKDLKGADGELVTVWGLGIGFGQRSPVTEANAAFIVRACNSHEALVALLREAYTDYSNPRFTDRHGFADRAKAVLDSIAKP